MKAHVDKHNRGILQPRTQEDRKQCNCRKADQCPLQGKCLQKSVVYQADVVCQESPSSTVVKTYYGLSERTFKEHYNDHTNSFRNQKYEGRTELSKHIWKLKSSNKPFSIKWSIKRHAFAYRIGSKQCNLCLCEKTVIALADRKSTLNSRSEILAKCRHKRKFCLSKF